MGKLVNLSDLEFYVNLMEENYNEVFTDHNRIVELLKKEFDIDTTIEQVRILYEPTIEEDSLDMQILYKNIFE